MSSLPVETVQDVSASWKTRVIAQINELTRKMISHGIAVTPEELALRTSAEYFMVLEIRKRHLAHKQAKAQAQLVTPSDGQKS